MVAIGETSGSRGASGRPEALGRGGGKPPLPLDASVPLVGSVAIA